ncbi:MAG: PH domain-containing protein [Thiomargarita sp.]|nr:PH domain-containing protein [Thiomargarita sp.]
MSHNGITIRDEEELLYSSNPSMIRNRPFLFIFSLLSIVAATIGLFIVIFGNNEPNDNIILVLSVITIIMGSIGMLVLTFWWLKVINMRLLVTNERVTFKSGILSRNIREVFLSDIRSVQINQSFLQRILGTGHIEVSSAASSDAEISIDGIPRAYKVKQIIDKHRRDKDKITKDTNE